MARPLKDGADYFPKDTSFYQDDKVRLLRAEFGAKGMYLLDYLLCDLYSKNGYYIKWDKNKCFLVSDGAGCGCSSEFVEEFISGCIRCSFFDERVFKTFGVLTSSGIQRRFVRFLKNRENFTFIEEYFLLDVSNIQDVPVSILDKCTFKKISQSENSVLRQGNVVKLSDNTQNKINKNKVNKIKEREGDKPPAHTQKKYGEYKNVILSDDELEKLKDEFQTDWSRRIERLSAYLEGSGKSYKNHYAVIREWAKQDKEKDSGENTVVKSKFNNYVDENITDYDELEEQILDNILAGIDVND